MRDDSERYSSLIESAESAEQEELAAALAE
jgi:hypothetical protein